MQYFQNFWFKFSLNFPFFLHFSFPRHFFYSFLSSSFLFFTKFSSIFFFFQITSFFMIKRAPRERENVSRLDFLSLTNDKKASEGMALKKVARAFKLEFPELPRGGRWRSSGVKALKALRKKLKKSLKCCSVFVLEILHMRKCHPHFQSRLTRFTHSLPLTLVWCHLLSSRNRFMLTMS